MKIVKYEYIEEFVNEFFVSKEKEFISLDYFIFNGVYQNKSIFFDFSIKSKLYINFINEMENSILKFLKKIKRKNYRIE
jgi:hypothetical protein